MPDYGYRITLRNLANHTSGIRDQGDLTRLIGIKREDVVTNDEIVRLVAAQKALNFAPGTDYEYCNSGYNLLAKIVERVSGQSFSQFTAERIFKPLNMKNTQFPETSEKVIKNKAYSYAPDGAAFKKKLLNFSLVGSTGLNTTVEDLSRWALNFEKPIVDDALIFDKMKEPGTLASGEKLSYALGQEVKEYKGLKIIFHGGGDAGYRAYLLRIPEQKFAVVLTANSEAFNPVEAAYKLVDIYLGDKEVSESAGKTPKAVSRETLQSYVGDYEVLPGTIFSISEDAGQLYFQTRGESRKTPLKTLSENEFLLSGLNLITFHKTRGEEIDLLKFHLYDFVYKGRKIEIEPFDGSKVNLREYAGRYYSAELGTSYEFAIENNRRLARHNRNADIELAPFQPNVFIGGESFFRKVKFIRNFNAEIIGCAISGTRAKEIHFEKVK